MAEYVLLFCCRSCLKGENDREYYNVLQLTGRNPTTDEVKKAYKKISLSLHPDKLAQRGIEVTAEKRQEFLLVKEAYDVLSNPKRRRLYDQVGKTGMKLIESPQEANPYELLRNFQRNRGDRCTLLIVIALVFAAVLILPILFSLKCDQTLGKNAPWVAIWTPMWIVDFFFLILAFLLFTQKDSDENEEEDADGERKKSEKIPMSVKIMNFVTTCLFILIQIFILGKLDHSFDMSWISTFAPWIVYEGLHVVMQLPDAIATVNPPSHTATDLEEGADEQEALLQQLAEEGHYLESIIERSQKRQSIWNSLLRIWLAAFLSVELDNKVDWNWGLVLLPIWVNIFSSFVYAFIMRQYGSSLAEGINTEEPPTNPRDAMKLQAAAGVGGLASTLCFSQCVFLLMALLLVFRLQMSVYSTFVIIFPVFVALGCCCCLVFCTLGASLTVDTEELLRTEQGPFGDQHQSDAEQGGAKEGYVAPIVVIDQSTLSPIDGNSNSPTNSNSNNVSAVDSTSIVLVVETETSIVANPADGNNVVASENQPEPTEDINEID